MTNDEVFGRVHFSVSTGLVPWGDPSEYVHTVTGKIIAYSETDDEVEAGEILLRVVSATEVTNTGEDLLDVCDADSAVLEGIYADLFDQKGETKEELDIEPGRNNLVFLEKVEVDPEFRQTRLMTQTIETALKMGHRLATRISERADTGAANYEKIDMTHLCFVSRSMTPEEIYWTRNIAYFVERHACSVRQKLAYFHLWSNSHKETSMTTWFCLTIVTFLVGMTATSSAFAADARLGGMRLLAGYEHQKLQGIDSIVGKVSKKAGLQISYEIGGLPKPGGPRLGGQFSDRPKRTPKNQVRWYLEQTVNGQPVHLAHRKDNVLLVSFPQKGMNFSVKVSSADEMAEALLMILTYPDPVADDGRKKKPPEKN